MKPVRTAGIVANPGKTAAVPIAAHLIERLSERNVAVSVTPDLRSDIRLPAGVTCVGRIADLARTDMILVLGGDGTLLHVVRELEGEPGPVLGINVGGLGFLSEVSSDDLDEAVDAVLDGRYEVLTRPLLRAVIEDEAGNVMNQLTALNDIVVDEGSHTRRAVRLQMFLGTREIGQVIGDGILVATPAGSTAYNLSAGGPILTPGVKSLVLTAICPHSMSFRPLVYPETETLLVEDVRTGLEVKVTADGQVHSPVPENGRVKIATDPNHCAHFVSLGRHTYFDVLRSKLRIGGGG